MSYLEKIEYEIVPKESLSVIRNCSGCGKKSHFSNTKKFRVNANGSKDGTGGYRNTKYFGTSYYGFSQRDK